MILIRYKDFSAGTDDLAGLHGKAEARAGAVTVYLLPGLTTWQRRAVIRRLRQEASRGFGPPLPQSQLAIALGLDRVRTAARLMTAFVRLHPAVTLLPSAIVVTMITLFVMASGGPPGITSGTRGGLADAAAVSGSTGSTARTVSAERTRARMARVAAVEGSGRIDVGRTELDRGGSPRSRGLVESAQTGARPSSPCLPGAGAWYAGPQVVTAAPWPPGDGQLARRCPEPRAVPPTDHLPGPPDFAW